MTIVHINDLMVPKNSKKKIARRYNFLAEEMLHVISPFSYFFHFLVYTALFSGVILKHSRI